MHPTSRLPQVTREWLSWSRKGSMFRKRGTWYIAISSWISLGFQGMFKKYESFYVSNWARKVTKNWEMVCLPGCLHGTVTRNWVTRCRWDSQSRKLVNLTESQQLSLSIWAVKGVQSVWDYCQASHFPTHPTSKPLLCISPYQGNYTSKHISTECR